MSEFFWANSAISSLEMRLMPVPASMSTVNMTKPMFRSRYMSMVSWMVGRLPEVLK